MLFGGGATLLARFAAYVLVIQAIGDCVLCFSRHQLHRGLLWTKFLDSEGTDLIAKNARAKKIKDARGPNSNIDSLGPFSS